MEAIWEKEYTEVKVAVRFYDLCRFVKTGFMDTLIRLRPEELTEAFFQKLISMAEAADRIEITINNADSVNGLSEAEISSRLEHLNQQQTTSFSMEDLSTYIKQMAD